ncbi:MAG: hypothetical protein IJ038_06585 [Clostridia bacterium]|nr:hypothetical protein [Clostridia bacterium]
MKRNNVICLLLFIVMCAQSVLMPATAVDSQTGTSDYSENSYVMEFSSEQAVADNVVSYGAATSAGSYDAATGALYITPAKSDGSFNPAAFNLDLSSIKLRADIYGYVAIKVKLKDTASTFGKVSAGTDTSMAYKNTVDSKTKTYAMSMAGQYKATAEWQVVALALTNADVTSGAKDGVSWIDNSYWQKICVDLLPYNYSEWKSSEGFYVASMGFFKSYSDIESYYDTTVEIPSSPIETNQNSIILNMNTEANISANVTGYGAATEYSFDSTEAALELNPKDNTKQNPSSFNLDVSSKKISAENLPYIVLKVKIKDTSSMFGNVSAATDGSLAYKEAHGGNTYVMQMSSMYSPTTEWQLIVVNINDAPAKFGAEEPNVSWIDDCNYAKFSINLLKYNYYDWRETEGFFVKSVGFFANKDAIKAYYGLSADSLPDSVEITDSAYIFNLASASNIGRNVSGFGSAASGIMDEEIGALYVAPRVENGNGTNEYGTNPAAFMMDVTNYNIDAGEYPLFAMKVKLKDIESIFGRIAACTDGTLKYKELYGGVTYMLDITNNGYEKTDEWQLVVIDIWNSKVSMGTKDLTLSWIEGTEWSKLVIDLIPFNYYYWTEDEGFWIEWAGFFKTRADVAAYWGE